MIEAQCDPGTQQTVSQAEASEQRPDPIDWDAFLNHTVSAQPEQHLFDNTNDTFTGGDGGMASWTDLFLGDANIDWIGFGDSMEL